MLRFFLIIAALLAFNLPSFADECACCKDPGHFECCTATYTVGADRGCMSCTVGSIRCCTCHPCCVAGSLCAPYPHDSCVSCSLCGEKAQQHTLASLQGCESSADDSCCLCGCCGNDAAGSDCHLGLCSKLEYFRLGCAVASRAEVSPNEFPTLFTLLCLGFAAGSRCSIAACLGESRDSVLNLALCGADQRRVCCASACPGHQLASRGVVSCESSQTNALRDSCCTSTCCGFPEERERRVACGCERGNLENHEPMH